MPEKKECVIIAGGNENDVRKGFPLGLENVFVIACDKGYEYALNQQIPVDYVCGDFDSCKKEIPSSQSIPCGVEVLPTHKDDTDLIHGIKFALNKGFEDITITCAGGGRWDHFLSNIQALVFAKQQILIKSSGGNAKIRLFDDNNQVYVVQNEEILFPNVQGSSLSVLSFSDVSQGVTIKGAEYEISDFTLKNSFPLGQSNAWKDEKVSISVKNGTLIVIISKLLL